MQKDLAMPHKTEICVVTPLLPAVRDLIAGRRPANFTELDLPIDAEQLVRCCDGSSILIVSAREKIDRRVIEAIPSSVRVLATYSAGYDHIDLAAAAERGLIVLNTPDALSDAVAEVAILLMLGAARRATEAIALLRAGNWEGWSPVQLPGIQISHRRLGIYGMGRIGRRVGDFARGFGMSVHYTGRRRLTPELEADTVWHANEREFLEAADVLVLACAATDETRGYLNADRLACLGSSSIVVNVARGTVVDDDALIAALSSRQIAAAGLDVYNGEPAIDPRYLALPNAFLLPHIGSSTVTARLAMAAALLDGLDALGAAMTPANLVMHSSER